MRLIDADAFAEFIKGAICRCGYKNLPVDEHVTVSLVLEQVIAELEGTGLEEFKNAPTVDAILKDDNFGFAGYIREKNENGYYVGETWNLELNDEELMCIMCGVIRDIKADERLSKLWMKAMDFADFIAEGETE